MGTNYYFNTEVGQEQEDETHIGKRSAAGLWCWDCDQTLCAGGRKNIHQASDVWHKHCQWCGTKSGENESLELSTAGRELGFNKTNPGPKTGIATTSSFHWAIPPGYFRRKAAAIKDRPPVINEYGDTFTVEEFDAILSECRNQTFDSIGKEFS